MLPKNLAVTIAYASMPGPTNTIFSPSHPFLGVGGTKRHTHTQPGDSLIAEHTFLCETRLRRLCRDDNPFGPVSLSIQPNANLQPMFAEMRR